MKQIWRLVPFFLLFSSCATKIPPPAEPSPVSGEYPGARLVFDRVGAVAPDRISLLFRLEADNPREEAAHIQVVGWKAVVNGIEREREGTIVVDEDVLASGSSGVYPLWLETSLSREMIPDSAGPSDGEVALTVDILFAFRSGEEVKTQVKALAVFPLVRKPEVRITAIAVKKAELINTRFKVSLKIDNPNAFPVELSAFNYELYNAGQLWADGTRADILVIPPEDSAETVLFLTMNFINMSRNLLNQIAAMRDIQYRFTGEATVSTGIDYLPQFRMTYDLAGYSEVIE
jgi:LEA14-like dessication related protein